MPTEAPHQHSELEHVFGPEGEFAQVFPNFEVRNEQIAMARAVEQALAASQHLLVEAGTGIGKSLAYLTPAAGWAAAHHAKVVVSTCTKILQNQLVKKDIPLLQQALGTGFSAEPVFGQENYLCRRRLRASITHGLFDSRNQAQEIEEIARWAEHSDGVLVDFPASIDSRTLSKVGRNSDNCLFTKCPFREDCCYFRARQRWQRADLLIINHSLYFANAEVGDRLLPEFDIVIFDEAHRLEEVCARYLGLDVSSRGIERLLNSVHNPRPKRGIVANVDCSPQLRRQIDDACQAARQAAGVFFSQIQARLPLGTNRRRIREKAIAENALEQPFTRIQHLLKELAQRLDSQDLAGEVLSVIGAIESRKAAIASFLEAADRNSVYWVESEGPGRVGLHSSLIDVAEHLRREVFDKRGTAVLTSATLTVNRAFDFVVDRLGARDAKTLLLDSPFDFPKQSLLCVGQDLPSPGEAAFPSAAAQAIDGILTHSQGRALVLFTSYEALNAVYDLVHRERYHFLRQGDASTFELLRQFKGDVSSVLFATQSFWEGIDVPGEALSCLIIARLPFEVPDDPRVEGIAESLRDQGREPFNEFQLPQAVLRFRQGFGRLIRHKTDRGVVCVLDKRITGKAYGRAFVNSLPSGIRVARDFSSVGQFLSPRG